MATAYDPEVWADPGCETRLNVLRHQWILVLYHFHIFTQATWFRCQ